MQFNSLKDVLLAAVYVVVRVVALFLCLAIGHEIADSIMKTEPFLATVGWYLFFLAVARFGFYPLFDKIRDIDRALKKKDNERRK